jgi:peptide/nickel transport system permease protein
MSTAAANDSGVRGAPTRLGWRRITRKAHWLVVPGLPLAILVLSVAAAIFAPYLTPFDPAKHHLIDSLMPPAWVDGGSSEHLLGTDQFGRDILSRLLYGARASFGVAALSLLFATILGAVAGLAAGYFGGLADTLLMRTADVMLSLPTILVALVAGIALGPSFTNLVLIIGVLTWPRISRLIRGETMFLKQADYVRYARATGVPDWLIIFRHILPGVTPTLVVAVTLEVANVILLEASLSFLGAGLPPTTASWGTIISDGRALLATGWWIALSAGMAVTITVLNLNVLGDWMRDHFDPRLGEVTA